MTRRASNATEYLQGCFVPSSMNSWCCRLLSRLAIAGRQGALEEHLFPAGGDGMPRQETASGALHPTGIGTAQVGSPLGCGDTQLSRFSNTSLTFSLLQSIFEPINSRLLLQLLPALTTACPYLPTDSRRDIVSKHPPVSLYP